MFKQLPFVALAAAALFLGTPFDGAAQQAPAAQETPDREELVTFTEAFVEIAEVREEIVPQIGQAESQEDAAALQAEANEKMLEVLEENEMSPERYNAITQQLNADEELRNEFEAILEEIGGPGA